MSSIKVIHYGIGEIGRRIVGLVTRKPDLEIVGAIDLLHYREDLGVVAGLGHPMGILISDDPEKVLATEADIVLHSTVSSLRQVQAQLYSVLQAGVNVISTCEELAYPEAHFPDIADKLDEFARQHGVTILGTGVNPGFAMDTLVLALTAVCEDIRQIKVTRIVDAARRRLPLQRKVGTGLSIDTFNLQAKAQAIRHAGLVESLCLIADGLGWELDDIRETIEPVVAQTEVSSEFLTVAAGHAAGIRQIARGWRSGDEVITLELKMYLWAEQPRDSILIDGDPPIDMTISGGIHGDAATAAIAVNAIPRVIAAPPGLITMKDLPLVHGWLGEMFPEPIPDEHYAVD